MIREETLEIKKFNNFEAFAIERLKTFRDEHGNPATNEFPPSHELKISYFYRKFQVFVIDILLGINLIYDSTLHTDLKRLKMYLNTRRKWKKSALKFESLP